MKFSREKNRLKKQQQEKQPEVKKISLSSPERGIIVPWEITPREAYEKFEKSNYRKNDLTEELLKEALEVARATGRTATIVVDYTKNGHSHMPKVSEHVYRNTNKINEFWI